MKLNEILLIGGAILAALVFSKNRESSSKFSNIPFINPFTDLLSKAQAQAINKQESNIATLENIKSSNLGIAQDILGYERNIADVKINQIQTELDKTRSFISQQQKVPYGPAPSYLPTAKGSVLVSKFDSQYAYNPTGSLFPDINIPLIASVRADFVRQANYETAQQNIEKSNQFAIRQQGEIDRLQEEYQTRFGGISRYG